MSESELEQGKAWIESQIRSAAENAGISLKALKWGQAGDDFIRDLHSVRLEFEGGSLLKRFSAENLEDCPNDAKVREKLQNRIKELVHEIEGIMHFERLKNLADRRPPELLEEPIRTQALTYLHGPERAAEIALEADMQAILDELLSGPQEYAPYRIKFRAKRNVLDQMTQRGLIEAQDGHYRITLRGLTTLKRSDRAETILRDLARVYEAFSSLAIEQGASERPISSAELAEKTGLNHDYTVELLALLFSAPANLWKARGRDQHGIARMTPNLEGVLDHSSLDSILLTLDPIPDLPPNFMPAPVAGKQSRVRMVFETATATYTSVSRIGQGGSGIVERVTDEQGAMFALKYLAPDHVSVAKSKRFKNEIAFCERDVHENVVRVLDYGFIELVGKKCPFYVMPIYDGTLRALMSGLKPTDVIPLYMQLLAGVEAAHAKRVWHRDLKPENVLHDKSSNRLVIADFGIAHFAEEHLRTTVDTRPGDKMANFQYAAPEQRQKNGQVDQRADIFALGLILNEMFTGHLALGVGYRTVGEVAPEFQRLDGLIQDMLRTDPARRPQGVAAVRSGIVNAQRALESWTKEKGSMSRSGVAVGTCELVIDGRCEAPPKSPPAPIVIYHDLLGRQVNACKRCSDYRIAAGEWLIT